MNRSEDCNPLRRKWIFSGEDWPWNVANQNLSVNRSSTMFNVCEQIGPDLRDCVHTVPHFFCSICYSVA